MRLSLFLDESLCVNISSIQGMPAVFSKQILFGIYNTRLRTQNDNPKCHILYVTLIDPRGMLSSLMIVTV